MHELTEFQRKPKKKLLRYEEDEKVASNLVEFLKARWEEKRAKTVQEQTKRALKAVYAARLKFTEDPSSFSGMALTHVDEGGGLLALIEIVSERVEVNANTLRELGVPESIINAATESKEVHSWYVDSIQVKNYEVI